MRGAPRPHASGLRAELRLLSLAGQFNEAPPTIYQELSISDIKFPTLRVGDGSEVVLSPGNYAALLEKNRDQGERGKAAATHLATYGANAHTYAAIYNATLQRDWFQARARNFDSTLDAALDGNAIPRAVVETLIDATRAGSAPFQRYARLRQKLLGLPSYHLYDSFQPIYRSDKSYPFEQARDLALASVAPLGDEYVAKYKRFISGGRIDVIASLADLPTRGRDALDYGFNFWPRLGGISSNDQIADFAPDARNITAGVPEPATWAMMILGFGFAGSALRRRNTASAV